MRKCNKHVINNFYIYSQWSSKWELLNYTGKKSISLMKKLKIKLKTYFIMLCFLMGKPLDLVTFWGCIGRQSAKFWPWEAGISSHTFWIATLSLGMVTISFSGENIGWLVWSVLDRLDLAVREPLFYCPWGVARSAILLQDLTAGFGEALC